MFLVYFLISSFFASTPPSTWGLYYKTQFKSGANSLSQYIVVQDETVTSIDFQDKNRNMVSSYRFSTSDSIVSIKTINHAKRICFYHEIPYREYVDSLEKNTVKYLDKGGNVIQYIDEKSNIKFTATLSDSLPNIHPKTMFNTNIQYLPVRFEYSDRISHLDRYITDVEELGRILAYVDTKGYRSLDLMDLKMKILLETGYTFEQMEEILKEKKN